MALISVIMPAFNAEKYISKSIESILCQSFANIELLILNDASKDSTLDIINYYSKLDKRITFFSVSSNLGYVGATNFLLEKSTGSFIGFQDADDFSEQNRFELQLEEFNKDAELAICGCWANILEENGLILRVAERPVDFCDISNITKTRNPIIGSTILMKKEVYEVIGGLRMYFNRIGYNDFDFVFRAIEKFKAINIPLPLYSYRQHNNSLSKNINPERLISERLVCFLGEQRSIYGVDGLDDIAYGKEFEQYKIGLLDAYCRDKSLAYREFASAYMYNNLYRLAVESSLQAIKKGPYKIKNYRLLQYCLRKWIERVIRG